MDKQIPYTKPLMKDITGWTRIFHNDGVEVYEADNYYDIYKVSPKNGRSKVFYGESAWMNAQRYAVDHSDFSAYNIFS